MYLRTCGSFSPQFTMKTNRKAAKCHICGRSANLTHYLSSFRKEESIIPINKLKTSHQMVVDLFFSLVLVKKKYI
jgi:hypothetical protein